MEQSSDGATFKQFTTLMTEKCGQNDSSMERRIAFGQRRQGLTESTVDYAEALKSLAKKAGLADECVRDQLICGMKNADLQRELLRHEGKPLDELIEIIKQEE